MVIETHPEDPIGTKEMIFDPKHMKELSKCWVSFLDSTQEIIVISKPVNLYG
jgi:putrescine transport system substrate-binding protein